VEESGTENLYEAESSTSTEEMICDTFSASSANGIEKSSTQLQL
jgi:hypothetical protein